MNTSNSERSPHPPGVKKLFRSAPPLARWFEKQELMRLATAICSWENRLAPYESAARGGEGAVPQEAPGQASSPRPPRPVAVSIVQSCGRLLEQARESLSEGEWDGAWECVQEVEREMLVTLSSAERKARWISAIEEAKEKLNNWRKSAAAELAAGKPNRPGKADAPSAAEGRKAEASADDGDDDLAGLREVLVHIHSKSQNTYGNIRRLRNQLNIAALCVTVMVLGILVLNDLEFFNALGPAFGKELPVAVLVGLLGGVLSVAYSVARSDPKQKIPEIRASFMMTLARPVIGAAVALPVLLFVASQVLKVDDQTRSWMILSLCFIAGFSERWFLGVVEKQEK